MRAILAYLTAKPGMEAEFQKQMTAQAKRCLANEPGCLQFDVVQDPKNPTRFVMLEVYGTTTPSRRTRTASTSRISARWSASWSPTARSRCCTWCRTARASGERRRHPSSSLSWPLMPLDHRFSTHSGEDHGRSRGQSRDDNRLREWCQTRRV